jgi:hypothetical protein
MMRRKVSRLIIFMVLIILTITNIAQAQPTISPEAPYGPKVQDLKGKEEIVKNFQDIKRIRANLSTININANLTPEELKAIDKDLENYIQQFNVIRRDLENHKITYKDSFSDVFFAEQILFVAESFIISLRQQQNLVRALEDNRADAKKLFHSTYLIPVYYYLTLGDQMIAYIDTYFVVS